MMSRTILIFPLRLRKFYVSAIFYTLKWLQYQIWISPNVVDKRRYSIWILGFLRCIVIKEAERYLPLTRWNQSLVFWSLRCLDSTCAERSPAMLHNSCHAYIWKGGVSVSLRGTVSLWRIRSRKSVFAWPCMCMENIIWDMFFGFYLSLICILLSNYLILAECFRATKSK